MSNALEPLVPVDEFPVAQTCTYINAANVTPMYRPAAAEITDWYRDVAEHGSNHFDEEAEATVFDDLHRQAARLFNASPADIAAGSSTTELLSSLAWAVMPGPDTNVVSTDVAFPASVYPWRRVANHTGCEIRLAHARGDTVDPDRVRDLVDDNTAVVALSHVEFRSGQRWDLAAFAEIAHRHGALLVVDATQSAGAVPIDAPGMGVDAVAAGAYKWLCGPFGIAVMYLEPSLATRLEPGLVGFRSQKDIWDIRTDPPDYPEDASRFEFSTMAYGLAGGFAKSIEFLVDTGIDRIFAHNQALADHLIDGLAALGAEVTSPRDAGERSAIVTARFPGRDVSNVAQHLKQSGVMVALRGPVIRFSPHLYNRMNDVERALEVISGMP